MAAAVVAAQLLHVRCMCGCARSCTAAARAAAQLLRVLLCTRLRLLLHSYCACDLPCCFRCGCIAHREHCPNERLICCRHLKVVLQAGRQTDKQDRTAGQGEHGGVKQLLAGMLSLLLLLLLLVVRRNTVQRPCMRSTPPCQHAWCRAAVSTPLLP